jgi:hypothetical protein
VELYIRRVREARDRDIMAMIMLRDVLFKGLRGG